METAKPGVEFRSQAKFYLFSRESGCCFKKFHDQLHLQMILKAATLWYISPDKTHPYDLEPYTKVYTITKAT